MSAKPPIVIVGMWGLGDNLHQRAVIRALLKTSDVWLETCHAELYHDLVEQGLKLIFKSTHLRAQARTIAREQGLFDHPLPPPNAHRVKLWYHKAEVDKFGSIAEAMFPPFGLRSERPDFSLPVKPEWTAAARHLIDVWRPTKPLMVFRPIVLRKEWDGAARNPDPTAYGAIFNSIREDFFVVSIADLEPNKEWIVGPDWPADVKLHDAQLDFPTLAGLWKEADLFFGNAGFGPVLAQAVGTPALIVYGGRESYKTTERAGAHLSPTLGIDPIHPCDCHSHAHRCDKRINVPQAIARAQAFANSVTAQVKLNFGCGTNHLPGWRNMDIEVNIEEPLPFDSDSADAIFSEHCVEHTSYYKAIGFFEEAFRVLKPGGLIRITVPSIEQVMACDDPAYFAFTSKWQKLGATKRGAMNAILFAHGHQTAWTASLLNATLYYVGFERLKQQVPGGSEHWLLRGLEGHGKVIGDTFNRIESLTFEGVKPHVEGIEARAPDREAEDGSAEAQAAQPSLAGRLGVAQADGGSAARSKILIFATTYVDSPERQLLTQQWVELHTLLNPDCDYLFVDSNSPLPLLDEGARARFVDEPAYSRFTLFDFGDNIGHLSRRGRDGWGRAFCKGLDYAVEHGYEHVVHIEGDSLCRVPARDIVAQLVARRKGAGSIPVLGTTSPVPGWAETGLMAFSTEYLARTKLTERYSWPNRQVRPTPELIVSRLIGADLLTLGLRGMRNDANQITYKNVVSLNLDWITHCHNDIWAYREFLEAAISRHQPASLPETNRVERPRNPEVQAPSGVTAGVKVAVVVGGAPSVMGEVAMTDDLVRRSGSVPHYFVINDMIPLFERPCTAVTLHPAKLKTWLDQREQADLVKPDSVWAHVRHVNYPLVTHAADDWRGSSGLFAIAVARRLGFEKIVLCGVPMRAEDGHVTRGPEPWRAADQFMHGWRARKNSILPYVRSWSGWTAETFGMPTLDFLHGLKELTP